MLLLLLRICKSGAIRKVVTRMNRDYSLSRFSSLALILGVALSFLGIIETLLLVTDSAQSLSILNLGIDTQAYFDLGKIVAQQGPAAIPDGHPPGFIFFLSLFFKYFSAPVLAFKICNVLLILGLAAMVYFIGKDLLGTKGAMVAAFLVCWSPGFHFYAATLQYEIVATFMLWLALFLFYRALSTLNTPARDTRRGIAFLVLSALTLAMAALVREPAALAFPCLFAGICFLPLPRARKAAIACLFSLIFVLPLGSWIGWRYAQTGIVAPVSTKASMNFRIGNNPAANGTFNLVQTELAEPSGLEFIKEHPASTLNLVFRKAGYLLGFLSDGWNVPRYGAIITWRVFGGLLPYEDSLLVASSLLSLLAIVGVGLIILSRQQRKRWLPLLTMVLLTITFYCAFFGSYRFMLPILPALYLFAAAAIVFALEQIPRGLLASLSLVGTTVWLSTLLFTPHFHYEITPQDLTGVSVEALAKDPHTGAPALFADSSHGPRLAGFMPQQYLPRGEYHITVHYRSTPAAPERIGRVVFRPDRSRPICEMPLQSNGSGSASMSCKIPVTEPLALEIHLEKSAALWIDKVAIES